MTNHAQDSLAHLIMQGPGSSSVYAVQQPNGSWSVVLELDGYYYSARDAVEMATFWNEQIARTETIRVRRGADVPHERKAK